MKKINKALISVSDKKNLNLLLKTLSKHKIQIISSGGTFKKIKKLGYKCLELSKFTGFKEILNGRVKTLHPKIHAGILSKRGNKSHIKDLEKNNFEEIDLVVVNFYPFEKTLELTNKHKKIIENIDIGGPTMVRAAAKNYNNVTVITKPEQYRELIEELNLNILSLSGIDLLITSSELIEVRLESKVSFSTKPKPRPISLPSDCSVMYEGS